MHITPANWKKLKKHQEQISKILWDSNATGCTITVNTKESRMNAWQKEKMQNIFPKQD